MQFQLQDSGSSGVTIVEVDVLLERISLLLLSGKRIVELVKQNLTPSKIMTYEAFENAIRVIMATGGSTNALIHVTAISGRLGIDIPLQLYDKLSRKRHFLTYRKV